MIDNPSILICYNEPTSLYNNYLGKELQDEDENIDCMTGGYLTLVSLEDLKAAAQAHHNARIMEAFNVETGE